MSVSCTDSNALSQPGEQSLFVTRDHKSRAILVVEHVAPSVAITRYGFDSRAAEKAAIDELNRAANAFEWLIAHAGADSKFPILPLLDADAAGSLIDGYDGPED